MKCIILALLIVGCHSVPQIIELDAGAEAPVDAEVDSFRPDGRNFVKVEYEERPGFRSGGDIVIPIRDSGTNYPNCDCSFIPVEQPPYICIAELCAGLECNSVRVLRCFYVGGDPAPHWR